MAIVERRNKDGSVRFQVKVKDSTGKWYEMPSFAERDQAEAFQEELFERNRKGKAATCEDARITSFLEYSEVWRHENRQKVSDGWKSSQDQMLRDHVEPVLGQIMMIHVAPAHIGRVLQRAKDRGLGQTMQMHLYVLMRQMFQDAIEYYEMLATNPVKRKFHRPELTKKQRRFLKPAEAMRLLEFTKDHYLGLPIWIMTLSAPRIGEMTYLRGRGIDLEKRQILISGTYDKKMKRLQDYPKNGAWAYIPIPQMLAEYLAKFDFGHNEFVAKSVKGEMLPYNTFQKALGSLCKKAGVPEITPHELRHTCTEIWIEAGASQEDIRRLLNHASLSSTGTYIHRTDDRLQMISEGVGRPLLRVVGNSKSFPNGQKQSFASDDEDIANAN